jgi:hypothetical protein
LSQRNSPDIGQAAILAAAFVAACGAAGLNCLLTAYSIPQIAMVTAGSIACHVAHRAGSGTGGVDFLGSGETAFQSMVAVTAILFVSSLPVVIMLLLILFSVLARLYLFQFLSLRPREIMFTGAVMNAVLFLALFYLTSAGTEQATSDAGNLILGYGAMHSASFLPPAFILSEILAGLILILAFRIEISLFLLGPEYFDLTGFSYKKARAGHLAATGVLSAAMFFCAGWLAAPASALFGRASSRGGLNGASALFMGIALTLLLLFLSDHADAYYVALLAVCVPLGRLAVDRVRGTGAPA